MSLPTAVLWDMDGTLVDTEPYWIECEYGLVEAHGGVWGEHHAEALVGRDLLTSARYLRLHGGVELPPETIVELMLDGVVDRVRRHIPWRPGALELLTELAELAVPCALVTMSYRRLAQTVIDALPAGRFATLVAGDDVIHGKPHPEPYLLAAERLGVRPGDCVAIEDSPTGLASAVAAGVPALGVEHLVPLDPCPGRQLTDTLVGVTAHDLGRLSGRLRPAG
ncbi:MAG TPA: HAD family phosphatase [Kineosporiaceae bacterium]|nr:HAD family phosphatase [Kineosporiaceae bacterium]